MNIYTQVNGSQYVIYSGMSQDAITTMWENLGWTGQFLTKDQFDAGVAALPHVAA